MTENSEYPTAIKSLEEHVEKDGETTTKRKSIMEINPDGSTTITDSVISSTMRNEIKLDENTKVNVNEVDAELDDSKYINALRTKNQLAALKNNNQMICLIPLSAAENIFKKMGTNIENDFSLFAFGIYSLEDINEIRKTSRLEKPKKPPNLTRDFYPYMPPLDRLERNRECPISLLFKNVQDRLDLIKAEEERKRREEEEAKRREEEEKRRLMEEKAKRKEKACNKLKKIRNDNRLEILKIKFAQYKKNIENAKIYETSRKMETQKKVLKLKIKNNKNGGGEGEGDEGNDENADNNLEEEKQLEEERLRQEEEERKKKEEEEERQRQEEEERKRKEEEEERLRQEEEERKKKEEEEERLRQEEEERKRKEEEEERLRQEEEERKRKEEEEERLRQEEEERKRKEEEEERLRQEEEERKRKEEEEERLRQEEEERKRKEEEEERLRQEEEQKRLQEEELNKKNKEQEEENERMKLQNELINNQEEEDPYKNSPQQLRGVNNNNNSKNNGFFDSNGDNNNEQNQPKGENDDEGNENNQKPKKKTVVKKVKKVVKVPKNKNELLYDNRKPFYISSSPVGGGSGDYRDYRDNLTYTGKIPLRNLNKKNECKYCHHEIFRNNNPNNRNEHLDHDLYICDNCLNNIEPNQSATLYNNFNDKLNNTVNPNGNTLRSYDFNRNSGDKDGRIGPKDYYEKNRNRYLNEFWKNENEDLPNTKRGRKSRTIEKDNPYRNRYKFNDPNEEYIYNDLNNIHGDKAEPRKIKRCRNKSTDVALNPRENNQILKNKNNRNLNNKNYLDGFNLYGINELECPKCFNSYVVSPNKRFYYCTDCQNIMCGKCSKTHYIDHPDHNCSIANFRDPDDRRESALGYAPNQNLRNKNNSNYLNTNPNANLNDLNGNKERKKRKINVNKYINKNTNLNPNQISGERYNIDDDDNLNSPLYKTNVNNLGTLRNKPNNRNNNYYNPNSGQMNLDENCYICGINKKEYPNERFYICRDCNHLLCDQCLDMHDMKNPRHNLVSSYNTGEPNKNKSNIDPKSIYYRYKNSNDNNLPYNNMTDNNYLKDNLNPQLYRTKDNNRGRPRNNSMDKINKVNTYYDPDNEKMKDSNFNKGSFDGDCFICGITQREYPNERFYVCRDCNHLLCNQCINLHDMKYPRHNFITSYNNPNNHKKEYQNSMKGSPKKRPKSKYDDIDDNKSQYYINKNKNSIDNISNLNKDLEDTNDYYNPNTYDNNNLDPNNYNPRLNTINASTNLSPKKKAKLRKFINKPNNDDANNSIDNDNDNNYNDDFNDDGGLQQNLRNRNNPNVNLRGNNININKKCKIEFDLNRRDSDFDKFEIFGSPTCFNCLKSKKNQKNIQIFFCNQCMKLFCRDCLNLHNYYCC